MNTIFILILLNFTCFPQTVDWLIGPSSVVVPSEPLPEGAADCNDATTDAINVASTIDISATQDSIIFIITHADEDSIWDVYWMLGDENALGDATGHQCWDSSGVRGTLALRYAVHIDSVAETDTTIGLNRGSFYSLKTRIKGEDIVGVSSWSDWDTVNVPIATGPDTTKPNPYSNVVAEGFNNPTIPKSFIVIDFDTSSSTDVNYTRIMRERAAVYVSGDSIDIVPPGAVSYTDTLVELDETWAYLFEVVDDTGNVSINNPSDSAYVPEFAALPNPDPPVLAAVADTFFVTLTADTTGCKVDGGGTIDSLKFYESGTLLVTQIALVYIHTGLIPDNPYSYTAKVKDSNGNLSAQSNTQNVTTIDSTLFSGTEHFVDNNASGDNDGRSWTHGWESFAAIQWGNVAPGDIIYISGGPDSTKYFERLVVGASGTLENRITIRNSYDANHNGRVIIDGLATLGIDGLIFTNGKSNITVIGLEVWGFRRGIYIHTNPFNITIDSCIIMNFASRGIDCIANDIATGAKNLIFENLVIKTIFDGGQTDVFYVKYSENVILRNSFLHVRNASPINSHSDVIQTNPVKGFRVYNNIMIVDSNSYGIVYIAGAIADNATSDSVIIYNNYMYGGGIWKNGDEPWVSSLNPEFANRWAPPYVAAPHYIAHNTVVVQGPWYSACHIVVPATMVNNIIVQFEGSNSPVTPPAGGGTDYVDGYLWIENFRNSGVPHVDSIRANLMWTEWSTGKFKGGPFVATTKANTWAEWVAMGGISPGVNGDPLFVDQIGFMGDQGDLSGHLLSGSPARNQGEDIQAIIEAMGLPWSDIDGVARDSTPDIGAYEYVP